ncbi:hypothetical protein [Nonomuraea sp. LPB2021202275-12-8]|uniref:hypothetical protein n=1 Tax=Nonomuraea sp. LPB2021202275-12-8 TaxID=3120159 RepID=UPI00300C6565
MNWFFWSTLTCLGVGVVVGGFRRKQDKAPRGKMGIFAATLLAYGSLALGAWLPGQWAAGLGAWVKDGLDSGDTFTAWVSGITGVVLVIGVASWATAAGKDVLKDKIPDEPALTFCIFWTVLFIGSIACVMGDAAYTETFGKLAQGW